VSDDHEEDIGLDGLLPSHEFFKRYLPKSPGSTPRTLRAEQDIIQRLRLPTVRTGAVTLVDVKGAARRLRELIPDAEPRPPGRPKRRPDEEPRPSGRPKRRPDEEPRPSGRSKKAMK